MGNLILDCRFFSFIFLFFFLSKMYSVETKYWIYAIPWKNLENMTLSGRNLSQKKKSSTAWPPLQEMSRVGKYLEKESKLVPA